MGPKMKMIAVLGLAAGSLWASTAHAHWQNTRWGMTEAEVRALWPTALEREESGQYLLRIDGPAQAGGLSYKTIRFVFDTKGKLREVRLDASEQFDSLRERMASQLGAPVSDEDKPFMMEGVRTKSALFRDTAKGNSVKLWSITSGTGPGTTLLTYRALETGF